MTNRWFLGTMGFSYKDWSGPFYPSEMAAHKYLGFYARYFNAVEIDSTFYGTPRQETVMRWKAVTPEEFQFCVKTPREITHEFRLAGAQAFDSMMVFLESISLLDEKLGVVLFQFAPTFKIDQIERLTTFLERLPKQYRYAVEFRQRSWYQTDTASRLQELGVSWASTEYPNLPEHANFSADHIYIRWIGRHGRFQRHSEEKLDMLPSLEKWKQRLKNSITDTQTIYGFFNNDYAGFAPGTCNKFKALQGLTSRSFERPQQGRLF